MEFYAMTDVGKRRPSNQDAYCAAYLPDGSGFFVLCDGMGGRNGGNVASELAVNGFSLLLRNGLRSDMRPKDLKNFLSAATERVNRMILNSARQKASLEGMGSTVVIAARCGKKVCFAHVGDSRIYRLRDGKLTRITKDHSVVQEMIDRGELSEQDAGKHPYRHVITRVLGTEKEHAPDLLVEEFRPGDLILLCSDGLYGVLSDTELEQTLSSGSPEQLPAVLVRKALDGGGPDNVTVGIIYEQEEARK